MTIELHLNSKLDGGDTRVRPEAQQFTEIERGVFGVEDAREEGETTAKRRRVEERGSQERAEREKDEEFEELERSGAFDEYEGSAFDKSEGAGADGGARGSADPPPVRAG